METTKRKNDLGKMGISNSFFLFMFVLISSVTSIRANDLKNETPQETFTVTQAPAENGSYTIDPTILEVQIEDLGHGFFNWIPDYRTRATFAKHGVKYADAMRTFFDGVFYKS